MSLLTDVLCLSETGWKVSRTNKLLTKAAAAIAIGGGQIEVEFEQPNGSKILLIGRGIGYGVGAGADFVVLKEMIKSLMKYVGIFKIFSAKSDLYRYALLNNEEPTIPRLLECDLVLTTGSANASVFGGSLDYYAFYRRGAPNQPLWMFFSAGTEISGGGSASTMQYKFEGLQVSS